jgi:hypothetical protein
MSAHLRCTLPSESKGKGSQNRVSQAETALYTTKIVGVCHGKFKNLGGR